MRGQREREGQEEEPEEPQPQQQRQEGQGKGGLWRTTLPSTTTTVPAVQLSLTCPSAGSIASSLVMIAFGQGRRWDAGTIRVLPS